MGRARTFDTTETLDKALLVFWRNGYDGTTLSDLTKELGIERPSLYRAYGNKEQLFERVVERYGEAPWAYLDEALCCDNIQEVAKALLSRAAELHTRAGTPGGCLEVQAALVSGDAAAAARAVTAKSRKSGEARLLERLEQASAEGELSPGQNPKGLASYLQTVVYGMAVQAASGATRKDLDRVIELALNAIPDFKNDGPAGAARKGRTGRSRGGPEFDGGQFGEGGGSADF